MVERFLVRLARGPQWDPKRGRREQARWDEHAAFIDALAREGVVLLGGPVGEGDGTDAVLVVAAASESDVRARLSADPWSDSLLVVASVERWSIWVGRVS